MGRGPVRICGGCAGTSLRREARARGQRFCKPCVAYPARLLEGPIGVSEVVVDAEADIEAQTQSADRETVATSPGDDLRRAVGLRCPDGRDEAIVRGEIADVPPHHLRIRPNVLHCVAVATAAPEVLPLDSLPCVELTQVHLAQRRHHWLGPRPFATLGSRRGSR
eukprot:scaffold2236_cov136-Isochrysis_galbana.AAC.5